jgi:hypothetical protein
MYSIALKKADKPDSRIQTRNLDTEGRLPQCKEETNDIHLLRNPHKRKNRGATFKQQMPE